MRKPFTWKFKINGKSLSVVFSHDGFGISAKVEADADADKELAERLTKTIRKGTEVRYGQPRIGTKKIWGYVRGVITDAGATEIVAEGGGKPLDGKRYDS